MGQTVEYVLGARKCCHSCVTDSQPGAVLSSRKHLAISGDHFGCHSWRVCVHTCMHATGV